MKSKTEDLHMLRLSYTILRLWRLLNFKAALTYWLIASVNGNNKSFVLWLLLRYCHNKYAKFYICFLFHGLYLASDNWTKWHLLPLKEEGWGHGYKLCRCASCVFTHLKCSRICHFLIGFTVYSEAICQTNLHI